VAEFDIYETIAAAVAQGREPDLSSFDPAEVRGALDRVLRFPVPREQFLVWLRARVQQLTDGKVTVEERTVDDLQDQEAAAVPELPLRLVIEGEPFAEPAVVRAADQAVEFPMRSG
jgi:hypothetical protein